MDVMSARRAIIAGQDQFIPPEYEKCDYLQCTGRNARIDTGVAGNDNTLKFDFTYMPLSQANYYGNFGNYVDENTKCWRIIHNTSSVPRAYIFTANARRAGSSTGIDAVSLATGSFVNIKSHFSLSYGSLSISSSDGFSQSRTQTDDETTAVSATNIAIGSTNITTSGGTVISRFYGDFKIWRGNTLIRNYAPVVRKSDSKAGYYDTVNHTFNPSIGSDDFIAGYDN